MSTLFAERYSCRAYQPYEITDNELNTILQAGLFAPSAVHYPSTKFYVLKDKADREKIPTIHPYCAFAPAASVAIIVCADLTKTYNSNEKYGIMDCSAAVENMLLCATSLKLAGCWCGICPEENRINSFRTLLNIPKTTIPIAVITIGKPKDEAHSPKMPVDTTGRVFYGIQ